MHSRITFTYPVAAVVSALLFGTCATAAPVQETVVSSDFEDANALSIAAPGSAATLTTDPLEIVAGKQSLKGDSRGSGTEWNEFFHSRDGIFQAREAYTVSFDYKVLARSGDATFYTLLRRKSAGNSSDGWKDWKGSPGDTGHVETSFATRKAGDYYLIIGIRNRGAIAIDNLIIKTDPVHRPLIADTPAPAHTWTSPGHRSYYVDSEHGDDSRDGLSKANAWRSLDRVNGGAFAPGDRILLRSGSSWSGVLAPGGSGAEGSPIVIDRYDRGARPRLDAGGRWTATVFLHNMQQVEVRNLDIANRSPERQPGLTGVSVDAHDFGEARHIVLDSLDVHDVMGSNVKSEGGGSGINCACGGDKVPTRFDGLLIQNCRLARTDRNGITMGGNWVRDHWYPSLRVVIRDNTLDDIGGDGIVPIGCDGALVEHNILHGGRMRADDYAAGIWPWSCDNTVVQYNEVSGMKGTRDGEGYDCDYNCRNTLFQYNYSHDNDGGFMLICNDGGQHLPWNIGNTGSTIRYNVSVNDSLHTFNISGPCKHSRIYNNVFYIGKGSDLKLVDAGNWGGAWADDTQFIDNIFYVAGKADFSFGGMTNTVFDHNAFFGTIAGRPAGTNAVLADPKLAAPGTDGSGIATAGAYRLLPGSPCIRAGAPIANNGGKDFWGRPIPAGPPSIGADQSR
jgi:hypothetical protein